MKNELKEVVSRYCIAMNSKRTSTSNHTQRRYNDEEEKKINAKYGADGEINFMKYLTKNHPTYFWYSFPNKWEAVDFYGIPRDGKVTEYDYHKGKGKVEVVIELKSKRLLCDKVSLRTRCAVKSRNPKYVAPYSGKFHFMNWSKYEYIKKRLDLKTIKKAFMVYDYMVDECEHKLTEYDPKNAGHYIFHEITPQKVLRDSMLEAWQDDTYDRNYNVSWGGNGNREVEDKLVQVLNHKFLPMCKFKYFLLPYEERDQEEFLKKQRAMIPRWEKKLKDNNFEFYLRADNKWNFDTYTRNLKYTRNAHLPHLTFDEYVETKREEKLNDIEEIRLELLTIF
tara:strand:- start:92 stop:1102 length:1011 start_codon:yes stop_codon:yes gene_type:complete